MKKGNKKKTILVVIIIIIIMIAIAMILDLDLGSWGFKEYHFYTVDKNMNNCGTISTYHGDGDIGFIYNQNTGREGCYIDKNKVTINIGLTACGNSIKITKLKIDKNMNVYIKAEPKMTGITLQCGECSPDLTIYFLRKVNSVTLVSEDGTELGSCK